MKFKLEIKPAIIPEERHKIQAVLEKLGYDVHGGGTDTDMSSCDISFSKKCETKGGIMAKEKGIKAHQIDSDGMSTVKKPIKEQIKEEAKKGRVTGHFC